MFYRGAAFTDARNDRLQHDVGVLVEDGVIVWMGPTDDAPDPGKARVIDGGGATIVPSMVDAHSHLTLPGGSHWIERGFDDAEELARVAEENARLLLASGVRWVRDVGSPRRPDPEGGERAMALQIRDAWSGRGRLVPYIRAAGTWIARSGVLPPGLSVEVEDVDALVGAVREQLDEGADLVKLYLDGPDPETPPWTADEVGAAVAAAHTRNARVTAHATRLAGVASGVDGGVDAIEHGFEIDVDVAARMAERNTFLVSTLAVFRSWETFAATSTLERFTEAEGKRVIARRREAAEEALRVAASAGVPVAAGSDFGGGSLRANQLAWEVAAMVDAGVEPWFALAAVTWRGGELLGEPQAGTVETGGPADFFLVHGDPLSDPAALWRVWRAS